MGLFLYGWLEEKKLYELCSALGLSISSISGIGWSKEKSMPRNSSEKVLKVWVLRENSSVERLKSFHSLRSS